MRSIPARRMLSFVVVGLVIVASCGSGGGSARPGGFATTANSSVLVSSVTKVILKSTGGGFVAQPPPGAGCDPQVWTYTLEMDGMRLSWDRCEVSGTGTNASDYGPATGMRFLTAAEFASLTTAVRNVHVSTRMICGADKANWTFEVASPTDSLVYGDDFYACQMAFDHYVESDGLSNLLGVILPLVPPGL